LIRPESHTIGHVHQDRHRRVRARAHHVRQRALERWTIKRQHHKKYGQRAQHQRQNLPQPNPAHPLLLKFLQKGQVGKGDARQLFPIQKMNQKRQGRR